MDSRIAKQLILSNSAVRREYEKPDIAFDIAKTIIRARALRGINQKKLADLVGTKQPSIARLESGSALPSLSFLSKIAEALDTRLLAPEFEIFREKPTVVYVSSTKQTTSTATTPPNFQLLYHHASLKPSSSFTSDFLLSPTYA